MRRRAKWALVCAVLAATGLRGGAKSPSNPYVRDPKQPIDEPYTQKIKEYTTELFFTSPLVDYLPASKTVPTPQSHRRHRRCARQAAISSEVCSMRMVEATRGWYSIGKTGKAAR
jgi:hypothetical protein